MLHSPVYHGSLRRVVAAFGALMNDVSIQRKNSDGDTIQTIKVPITYAPKQRFYQMLQEKTDSTNINIVLPRMAYEMTSIFYDSQRKVNTLNKIKDTIENEDGVDYYYAPVPYNVTFSLYIATKNTDDMLQIIESIVPYFRPHFNISIWEIDGPGVSRDIPITLTNMDFSDTFDGDPLVDRTIIWTLNFQANTFIYGPTKRSTVIKQANIDAFLNQLGTSGEQIQSNVVPSTAYVTDPHEIQTTITEV